MMENLSQPKATLTVKVMEHGTIVGTNDPITLEFEDCINAVNGLVHWLASILAEVNDEDAQVIGSEVLIAALNEWTFNEHIDESDDFDEDEDEEDDIDDEDDDLAGPPPGIVN
ncbi:MAG: hypothetical protein JW993_21345 [Sedimentisphaerales bacterium]|nr:hypothetical protein [Sedimentisphaerales bacterium]